jgi:Lipocalin-like domain
MTKISEPQLRAGLLGTWRLVTLEMIGADGAVTLPLGAAPRGQLVYDDAGRMSAQLVRSDEPRFTSDDNRQALSAEAASAWYGYIGYFGTFSLDAQALTVTHHVEGAWFPNMAGMDQVRSVRIEGGRLVLEGATPMGRAVITWVKARPLAG